MNACMWAAVRLDKDGDQSQRALRNLDVESIQKVFTTSSWVFKKNCLVCRTSWIGPKVHGSRVLRLIKKLTDRCRQRSVFEDSVLRLGGKCPEHPRSGQNWETERIAYFGTSQKYDTSVSSHLRNIVNSTTSLESRSYSSGNIFPARTTMQPGSHDDDERRARNSAARLPRARCATTSIGRRRTTKTLVSPKSSRVSAYASVFLQGVGRGKVVWDPLLQSAWRMEPLSRNDDAAGHPVFQCTSPLSRGTLKSEGGGQYPIRHNAEPPSTELLLMTNHCRESARCLQYQSGATVKVRHEQPNLKLKNTLCARGCNTSYKALNPGELGPRGTWCTNVTND